MAHDPLAPSKGYLGQEHPTPLRYHRNTPPPQPPVQKQQRCWLHPGEKLVGKRITNNHWIPLYILTKQNSLKIPSDEFLTNYAITTLHHSSTHR